MSFEGDLKLFLGENGASVKFMDGQPEMDRGLENYVLISLFTGLGWAGNALLNTPIGSSFEERCAVPITATSLEDARRAALQALDSDVLGDVTVTLLNPTAQKRELIIGIKPPGRTEQEIRLSKSGENWIFQMTKKPDLKPRGTGSSSIYEPPTIEFLDNFNDANGTPITGHPSDSGHNWINLSGAGEIQGNRLAAPLSSSAITLVTTSFSANGALSGVMNVADVNQTCGLIFRAKDFSNMLVWFYLGTAWKLVRYTGGVPVDIATDFRSDGFSAGDNDIKVSMSGDFFTLTIREGQIDEVVLGPYEATTSWPETKIGAYVSTGISIASRRRHFESLQFLPA